MTRIVFINRLFFPDYSATSQILGDLAFHLAASGKEVRVITSRQTYQDPDARLPAQERVWGVDIHRISTTRFGRSALPGRALDYLSFYASASHAALTLVAPNDILVTKTDPPMMSVLAQWVARRRRAYLINWLQDLYPEVAVALGIHLLKGPIGSGLGHARDVSLRAAAANVVLGDRMAETIASRGVSRERIHVIPNWVDDQAISPVEPVKNPLRRHWGLADKFVVGYSGNLGRAHEFETILAAAERLRSHPDIVFLFVGGGHHIDSVRRSVKERGLADRFVFHPYQERSKLSDALSVPDVHWLSLRPELEGLIVPSKIYGILAAGRAVIAITSQDGEIARMVHRHEFGVVIEPGNADGLAVELLALSRDRERCASFGALARSALNHHFTRRQAFERWTQLLDGIEKG